MIWLVQRVFEELGTVRPFQREILSQGVHLSPTWISREICSVKKKPIPKGYIVYSSFNILEITNLPKWRID